MVHGTADISTRGFDPRRFGIWADAGYARQRAVEDYTLRQAMPYPQHQRETCRDMKLSGAHDRTAALGAVFEEAGGWERPRTYAPEPLGWRRTEIFEQVARECATVRKRVGLGDFSAFAKFIIEGPGAENWLNRVCANRMPEEGRCCLTLLLNHAGTIEGEATVFRLGAETFYFVTGAPSERRVWDWLTLHCGAAMQGCTIRNVTDETGVLVLAGPHARDVLSAVTGDDVSNAALPWMRGKSITIKGADVLALRLSFTGELAYELHVPNTQLGALWDSLWQAGESLGIGAFGSKALDSLRLEKFYRGGHELANDASHKDVEMLRFADMDNAFIGKEAMLAREPSRKIALLALQQEETDALISEAVFHDGRLVGSITSAGYGHTVGQSLAIAFLYDTARSPGTQLQVSLLGECVPAVVLPGAPWDPGNTRLKT